MVDKSEPEKLCDNPTCRPLLKPLPGQPIRRGDKPRLRPDLVEAQGATKTLLERMRAAQEENKKLRGALKWFCMRAQVAGVRSKLTQAVFMMLLTEDESERRTRSALADKEAKRRKEAGYPELDWNWSLGEDEDRISRRVRG